MFKLNFYDEKPFMLLAPKSFDLFKEKVSNNYGFSIEDANEFSYSYLKEEERKYLKSLSNYLELIDIIAKMPKNLKKQIEIFIEINETSKIFKDINAENENKSKFLLENDFPNVKKEEKPEDQNENMNNNKNEEELIKLSQNEIKIESNINLPEKEKEENNQPLKEEVFNNIMKNVDFSESFELGEYNIINLNQNNEKKDSQSQLKNEDNKEKEKKKKLFILVLKIN